MKIISFICYEYGDTCKVAHLTHNDPVVLFRQTHESNCPSEVRCIGKSDDRDVESITGLQLKTLVYAALWCVEVLLSSFFFRAIMLPYQKQTFRYLLSIATEIL